MSTKTRLRSPMWLKTMVLRSPTSGPSVHANVTLNNLIRKMQAKAKHLLFVYEPALRGYWLYRYLTHKGPPLLGGGAVSDSEKGRRPRQNRPA